MAFEDFAKLEKVKAQHLDDLWLSLNMALIGEGFAECCGELVRGATVSLRSRVTKVALWLTRADDEEVVMAIGREYRKVLADTPGTKSLATKDMAFKASHHRAFSVSFDFCALLAGRPSEDVQKFQRESHD